MENHGTETINIQEMESKMLEQARQTILQAKIDARPMIYGQMAKAIRDIASVAKTKLIDGKKPYRGIDDVTNAVKPVLGEHGIVPVSQVVGDPYFEERAQGKATYVKLCLSVIFYAEDGSHVDYLFWGDATVYGPGALMAATTFAYRQVLEKAFCIATQDAIDAEAENADAPEDKTVKPANTYPPPTPKQVNRQSGSHPALDPGTQTKQIDKTSAAYRTTTINKIYKLHAREASLLNLSTPKPHEIEAQYKNYSIELLETEGRKISENVKKLCIKEILECHRLEAEGEIETPKEDIFTEAELASKKLDELWGLVEKTHKRLEDMLVQ